MKDYISEHKIGYPEHKNGFPEFGFNDWMGKAMQRGFPGGGAPYLSDAFEYWNGTILDVAGTKYFTGRNSHNLLITGYDFDSTWLKGFPYKSAATVSAPAGDADFIAADLNNFFYDSGGTPNQIPVVSFFQNVDYAGRLFSLHTSQALDSNLVETREPSIKEIVLYATEKTGANLTQCNNYFKVPTEDATAKWVDFATGDDTNGNGTKALPYKTIAKILTLTLTNGSNIYIKTGLSPLGTQQNITKAYKYNAIGFTRIASTGFGFYVTSTAETELNGFVLTTVGAPVYVNNAILTKLNRCYTTTGNTQASILFASSAGINAKHCVFNGAGFTTKINETVNAHAITLDTCYQNYVSAHRVNDITGNLQANTFSVVNCKLANYILLSSGTWTIKGNKFVRAALGTDSTYDHVGTINFTYNTLIPNAAGLTLIGVGAAGTNKNNFDFTANNNYIVDAHANTTCMLISEQLTVSVQNNKIHHTGAAATLYRIQVLNTAATTTSCKIKNNAIFSNSSCSPIGVGNDTAACANKVQGVEIENNNVYNTAENTNHGIAVFRQNDFKVSRNKLTRVGIGVVTKALDSESSGGIVDFNILDECINNLLAKGSNGVLFYNNTINNTTKLGYAFGAIASEYVGSTGALNCEFKNNIVNDSAPTSGIGDYDHILHVDSGIDESDLATWGTVFTNNNIRTVNNKYSRFADTLALAQADGLETDSIGINPNLTAGLWPLVPIKIGADLTGYTTGLDITTNWGSSLQIPVIVTKENIDLQIGAYIQ